MELVEGPPFVDVRVLGYADMQWSTHCSPGRHVSGFGSDGRSSGVGGVCGARDDVVVW